MRLRVCALPLLACALGCEPASSPPAPPQEGAFKIGSPVPAFTTKAVTGPDKGKALCYV